MPGTLAVESLLLAVGVGIYLGCTSPRDRASRFAFAGLIALLVMVMLATAFGPPPPGVQAVAWSGHALWLFVALGYWVDRHRVPRSGFRWPA